MNMFMETTVDDQDIIDFWTSWQITKEVRESIQGEGAAIVQDGDSWHSISKQIYGTREFWWVLALFNNVQDPFEIFFSSSINDTNYQIKYIKPEYVNFMVDAIRRNRTEREKNKYVRDIWQNL